MKKSMLLAGAALLFSAAATPAMAQNTISPGMTTTQVRERFGAPATTREQGDWTYWYYLNGCPVRCGSDDVVFFQNDRVVAAVLRTHRRRFAGPAADDALGAAAPDAPAAQGDGPARVGSVRVEGAAPDVPVNQPREGQPGEPSTIVITQPGAAPSDAGVPPVPVNEAREGQAGEPSTIRITTPPAADDAAPGTPVPNSPQLAPDPAQNTEAADTRGETSIDRKSRRVRQDRANEPSATERARRNDARNP